MRSAIKSSPSLRRIISYLEWILIALTTFVHLAYVGSWKVPPEYHPHLFVVLSIFAVLSFFFPEDKPLWYRQLYIYAGILLAILSRFFGLFLDLFIYLYVAKSYFLLNRKHIILTIFLAGIILILINILALPTISQIHGWNVTLHDNDAMNFYANAVIDYLMANTFLCLVCCVAIAEQKSRQRAEALADQVETLAAALERTRLARDIHDSLGHTLTSLDTRLAVAQKLRQVDPEKSAQAMDTAKLLARQCIEDVSRALKTMRQSDFDLYQALTALMEQLRYNQSLKVQWEINLPKLSLQTSHQIYCIVKEGVINIQKHADASEVLFQAQSTSENIILELRDDGRGIDPTILHSGFGLQGMRERAKMLGGKLLVNSSPGAGTQIKVILPL